MSEDFRQAVEMSGTDSTRLRSDKAGQTLTLDPGGLRQTRGDKRIEIRWRSIESIELLPMSARWSTARAWAFLGRDGSTIFPHEYDEHWTAGPIGQWLRHYRPDLDLPDATSLKVLPLGIPNHQIPWVVLPGVVVLIVVAMVQTDVSPSTAVLLGGGCLTAVLLWVASPRWERVPRYAMYGVSALVVLATLAGWLLL